MDSSESGLVLFTAIKRLTRWLENGVISPVAGSVRPLRRILSIVRTPAVIDRRPPIITRVNRLRATLIGDILPAFDDLLGIGRKEINIEIAVFSAGWELDGGIKRKKNRQLGQIWIPDDFRIITSGE